MPLFRLVLALCLGSTAALAQPPPARTIAILGDSLSAGLGVQPEQAFPALVQQTIRERGLPFEVINAGVSGDTTAGGLRRLDWLLQRKIDLLIIELGGNDGLRGLPMSNIKANLQAMIEKARAKNPEVKIVIAGMQMPPNVGATYAEEFRQVFAEVARENNATMIPFLLEGVGGRREFNQPDLIHPNPIGHKMVADVVWKAIEPLLMSHE
ncbi:MAG: arylesterase [Chthoniobacterales bacterium]